MIKRRSRVEKEVGNQSRVWNGQPVSIVIWDTDSGERTPGFKPLIEWLENRHVSFSLCEWPDDGRIGGIGKNLPWEKEELDEEPLLEPRWTLQSDLIEVHVGHRWFLGFVPELMELLCLDDCR